MLTLCGKPLFEWDREPLQVDTRKALALLAYLVVQAEPITRSKLSYLLWPESEDARALASLRRTLSALKKTLPDETLHATEDTIALAQEKLEEADFWHIYRAMERAQTHHHTSLLQCDDCVGSLVQAASLYRGPFLEGFSLRGAELFTPWIAQIRAQLQRDMEPLWKSLIGLHWSAQEWPQALSYAQRWVDQAPHKEDAHSTHLKILMVTEQWDQAAQCYRAFEQRWREELDLPLQASSQALWEQIQRQDRTIVMSTPFALPWESQTPQHQGAALQRQGVAAAPPDATMRRRTGALPLQPTPFVGRTDERQRLEQLLVGSQQRWITLAGPGGIGKTRLMLAVGQMLQEQPERFVDGIVFVPLASIVQRESLVFQIAQGIGFSFYGEAHDHEAQLCSYLQHKDILLLLDNFEQLQPEADLLSLLVSRTHKARLLVTSRERLRQREEHLISLKGLAYPEGSSQWSEQSDAIALFVQSARRTNAQWTPTAEDRAAIVSICQLVEGIPLSLELAAAWTRMLTCAEIAEELSRDLELLETSLLNVPQRHQSQRQVFEYSWRLLSDEEQEGLAALSVFRESFSLEAAQQVANAALPLLLGLLDASLVRKLPSDRMDLLLVLRQYAAEKLSLKDAPRIAAQRAHSRFYLRWLQREETRLEGQEQLAALDALKPDLSNIMAAWDYAVEHQEWALLRDSIAVWSHLFFVLGRFRTAERRFKTAWEALTSATPQQPEEPSLQLRLCIRLGMMLERLGHREQAMTWLERAEALLDATPDPYEQSLLLEQRSRIAEYSGNLDEAKQLNEQNLQLSSATHNPQGIVNAYIHLGDVYRFWGQIDKASECFAQAMQHLQEQPERHSPRQHTEIEHRRATLMGVQGKYDDAQELFQKNLATYRAIGDQFGEVRTLANLGILAYLREEYEVSQRYREESVGVCRQLGYISGLAMALHQLGDVARKRGELLQAQEHYEEALHYLQSLDEIRAQIGLHSSMGHNAMALGRWQESWYHLRASLRMAHEHELMPLLIDLMQSFAIWFHHHGDLEQTRLLLEIAMTHPSGEQQTRDKAHELSTSLLQPEERVKVSSQDDTTQEAWREWRQIVDTLLNQTQP